MAHYTVAELHTYRVRIYILHLHTSRRFSHSTLMRRRHLNEWEIVAGRFRWNGVRVERGSCTKNRFECWIMHNLLALCSVSDHDDLYNIPKCWAHRFQHTLTVNSQPLHSPLSHTRCKYNTNGHRNIQHDELFEIVFHSFIGKTVVRAQHIVRMLL